MARPIALLLQQPGAMQRRIGGAHQTGRFNGIRHTGKVPPDLVREPPMLRERSSEASGAVRELTSSRAQLSSGLSP